MKSALALASIIIFISTILPQIRSPVWWIRGLDFPRLQIAIIACAWLALGLLAASRGVTVGWPWWALVIFSAAYQLWWIYPYTRWHRLEVARSDEHHNGSEVSLLTCNVLMDNRDAQPLIKLIRQHQPDVLATLETDAWWEAQLDVLDEYPHRLAHPLDNRYGMHIYSRLPLLRGTVSFLVEDDVPSMGIEVQPKNAARVKIHILHPRPPAPGENYHSTERDVELLVLAQHLQGSTSPLIVSGDLNDVAWSRTTRLFRRVSGLLDIRVGRGMFNTFHAEFPVFRWPLDHIFVSGHFKVKRIERLPYIGSDHFPVLAQLVCESHDEQEPHLELEDSHQVLIDEIMDTEAAAQATEPRLPA
jgi:endonuclease/exonuclease/phosphatase (EEP) superfamily protein YafD